LTIDTHQHMLPDFFWTETNHAHGPVGGLAPLKWSKEASISFMDDAGIDVAVLSLELKRIPDILSQWTDRLLWGREFTRVGGAGGPDSTTRALRL
jgi:hypothetical protein